MGWNTAQPSPFGAFAPMQQAGGWPGQMMPGMVGLGFGGDFGAFGAAAATVPATSPMGLGQQPPAGVPPPSAAAVADFVRELGISPSEEEEFAWIAEYGLLPDALPPGWGCQVDRASGKLYYVDEATQASSWENPLMLHLLRVVEAGRAYLQSPIASYFDELREVLIEQFRQEHGAWMGPVMDDDGRAYYTNELTGEASWQDPCERARFCAELESNLLRSLATVLPPPEDLLGQGVPMFGGGSGSWTKVVTESGAEVLTLDGASPTTPRRAAGLLRSLALESSANERAGTLQSMGRCLLWINDAAQAEELRQRRQLKRLVEMRRLRKLRHASVFSQQGSKDALTAIAEDVGDGTHKGTT